MRDKMTSNTQTDRQIDRQTNYEGYREVETRSEIQSIKNKTMKLFLKQNS